MSYPNSPVGGDYFTNEFIESELQNTDINHPSNNMAHPAHNMAPNPINNFISGSNTLGRSSARFGSRKSPFQVVIPSNGLVASHAPLSTPPVCSTPQSTHYPILTGLTSPNRNLGEFSTFGGGQMGHMSKLREESLEPSGHLV